MNLKTLVTACIVCLFVTTACIKSEAPDREADILSFTIEDERFLTSVFDEDNPIISLILSDVTGYNTTPIIPEIAVSDGATVTPSSGSEVTFANYQHYFTVKAEDGGEKVYSVFIKPPGEFDQDFEEWDIVNKYYKPTGFMWVNANAGVRLVLGDRTEYPSSRSEDAKSGTYSAKLSTLEGKTSESDVMDLPVLAGNMYCGEFNLSAALINPLTTTKFGQPYPHYLEKPLILKASYKYKRGKNGYTTYNYVNGKKQVITLNEGDKDYVKDSPDIYAILYKVTKGKEGAKEFLTAENIKTSNQIIAKALLDKATVIESDEWTELNINFVYSEAMDYTKYNYKLAIVLTSSENGAEYKGAIGSELLVDDLEIITEEVESSNE